MDIIHKILGLIAVGVGLIIWATINTMNDAPGGGLMGIAGIFFICFAIHSYSSEYKPVKAQPVERRKRRVAIKHRDRRQYKEVYGYVQQDNVRTRTTWKQTR